MNKILVEVSVGELLDKLTILEIKKDKIKDVKEAIGLAKRKYADINRQELRLEPKGKFLKDEVTLEDLGLNTGE